MAAETSARSWPLAVLAALIVAGIAGSYSAGLFGPVEWKAIDMVRLLAEALLLAVALVIFSRPPTDRPKFPVFVMVLLGQTPLVVNTTSPVVQAAAAAVTCFAVLVTVVEVLRHRRARKAKAVAA